MAASSLRGFRLVTVIRSSATVAQTPLGARGRQPRTAGSYRVRREIALDSTAPTGDRLRAIEQIESRALGRPKETVATEQAEPEEYAALRAMTPEARRLMLRRINEAEAAAAEQRAEAAD